MLIIIDQILYHVLRIYHTYSQLYREHLQVKALLNIHIKTFCTSDYNQMHVNDV